MSTDYTGAVKRTEDSSGHIMGPFGDNFTETLGTVDYTGFAGGFWDVENNGFHFGAREYEPLHGTWRTPDPAEMAAADLSNPQSWNLYAYVMNDPVNFVDPTGLYCRWDPDQNGQVTNDATGDADTGTQGQCEGLGGNWVPDNGVYTEEFLGNPTPDNLTLYSRSTAQVDRGDSGGSDTGTVATTLACAAQFGQNHSIAAAFGAQNNFVANLFGGNSVSGLVNLGLFISGNKTPTAAQLAAIPLKGAAQGIPIPPELSHPGVSGAVGQVRSLGVQSAVAGVYNAIAGVGAEPIELGITAAGSVATPIAQLSTETLSNVAFGVGALKFVFDLGTFSYGYFFQCQ